MSKPRTATTRRATEGASSAAPKSAPVRPGGVSLSAWGIGLAWWGGFALLVAAFLGAW